MPIPQYSLIPCEMKKNPYREYLIELTEQLICLSYQAKEEAATTRFDFERGKLFAYADLLDRMKRQTHFFEVSEEEIGLDRINSLQALLGIND